jgi:O-antigen biosynthesis protein
MTVAFITRDFTSKIPPIPGGCAYYRCYLPMAVIGAQSRMGLPAWDPIRGFGVKESETMGVFGYSTVVLKLMMERWIPRQIELAQSLGQKIVVDLDDYYQGLTPANKAYRMTHPDKNKNVNREHYEKSIMLADVLTVSTPFLKDFYDKQRDNVYIVRNGVNMNQFTKVKHINNKPVIGWAGAVSYRNNDLEILSEWLPDFLEEHDLYFHHAGHVAGEKNAGEVIGINPQRIKTNPLVPITEYAEGLKFDIGLIPLNDIPFNYAKSNIKGLEYAASGIPFIASDTPEYRLLHNDGVGRIATTPADWKAHAEQLLDYHVRKKEAKFIYDIVESKWSIEKRRQDWLTALA